MQLKINCKYACLKILFLFKVAFGSVGSKPAATGFSFGAKPSAPATSEPAKTGFSFGAKPSAPATTEPAKTGFSFGDKPAAKPSESGLSLSQTMECYATHKGEK